MNLSIAQKPWHTKPYTLSPGCLLLDANGGIVGAFPAQRDAEYIIELDKKVTELETEVLRLQLANEVLVDKIGQQEEKLKSYRLVETTHKLI